MKYWLLKPVKLKLFNIFFIYYYDIVYLLLTKKIFLIKYNIAITKHVYKKNFI